jgi:uncharacterized protein
MTTLARHRAAILRIAAKYGATNIRVAGSARQEEEQPDGDLDLLVDMDPDRSLFDLVDLGHELTALLGRRVEVITPASLNPRLRANVLADAEAL